MTTRDARTRMERRMSSSYTRFTHDLCAVFQSAEGASTHDWSAQANTLVELMTCISSHANEVAEGGLPEPERFLRVLWLNLSPQRVLGVQRKALELLRVYLEAVGGTRNNTNNTTTTTSSSLLLSSPSMRMDYPYIMIGLLDLLPQAPMQLKADLLLTLHHVVVHLMNAYEQRQCVRGVLAAVLPSMEEPDGTQVHQRARDLLLALRTTMQQHTSSSSLSAGVAEGGHVGPTFMEVLWMVMINVPDVRTPALIFVKMLHNTRESHGSPTTDEASSPLPTTTTTTTSSSSSTRDACAARVVLRGILCCLDDASANVRRHAMDVVCAHLPLHLVAAHGSCPLCNDAITEMDSTMLVCAVVWLLGTFTSSSSSSTTTTTTCARITRRLALWLRPATSTPTDIAFISADVLASAVEHDDNPAVLISQAVFWWVEWWLNYTRCEQHDDDDDDDDDVKKKSGCVELPAPVMEMMQLMHDHAQDQRTSTDDDARGTHMSITARNTLPVVLLRSLSQLVKMNVRTQDDGNMYSPTSASHGGPNDVGGAARLGTLTLPSICRMLGGVHRVHEVPSSMTTTPSSCEGDDDDDDEFSSVLNHFLLVYGADELVEVMRGQLALTATRATHHVDELVEVLRAPLLLCQHLHTISSSSSSSLRCGVADASIVPSLMMLVEDVVEMLLMCVKRWSQSPWTTNEVRVVEELLRLPHVMMRIDDARVMEMHQHVREMLRTCVEVVAAAMGVSRDASTCSMMSRAMIMMVEVLWCATQVVRSSSSSSSWTLDADVGWRATHVLLAHADAWPSDVVLINAETFVMLLEMEQSACVASSSSLCASLTAHLIKALWKLADSPPHADFLAWMYATHAWVRQPLDELMARDGIHRRHALQQLLLAPTCAPINANTAIVTAFIILFGPQHDDDDHHHHQPSMLCCGGSYPLLMYVDVMLQLALTSMLDASPPRRCMRYATTLKEVPCYDVLLLHDVVHVILHILHMRSAESWVVRGWLTTPSSQLQQNVVAYHNMLRISAHGSPTTSMEMDVVGELVRTSWGVWVFVMMMSIHQHLLDVHPGTTTATRTSKMCCCLLQLLELTSVRARVDEVLRAEALRAWRAAMPQLRPMLALIADRRRDDQQQQQQHDVDDDDDDMVSCLRTLELRITECVQAWSSPTTCSYPLEQPTLWRSTMASMRDECVKMLMMLEQQQQEQQQEQEHFDVQLQQHRHVLPQILHHRRIVDTSVMEELVSCVLDVLPHLHHGIYPVAMDEMLVELLPLLVQASSSSSSTTTSSTSWMRITCALWSLMSELLEYAFITARVVQQQQQQQFGVLDWFSRGWFSSTEMMPTSLWKHSPVLQPLKQRLGKVVRACICHLRIHHHDDDVDGVACAEMHVPPGLLAVWQRLYDEMKEEWLDVVVRQWATECATWPTRTSSSISSRRTSLATDDAHLLANELSSSIVTNNSGSFCCTPPMSACVKEVGMTWKMLEMSGMDGLMVMELIGQHLQTSSSSSSSSSSLTIQLEESLRTRGSTNHHQHRRLPVWKDTAAAALLDAYLCGRYLHHDDVGDDGATQQQQQHHDDDARLFTSVEKKKWMMMASHQLTSAPLTYTKMAVLLHPLCYIDAGDADAANIISTVVELVLKRLELPALIHVHRGRCDEVVACVRVWSNLLHVFTTANQGTNNNMSTADHRRNHTLSRAIIEYLERVVLPAVRAAAQHAGSTYTTSTTTTTTTTTTTSSSPTSTCAMPVVEELLANAEVLVRFMSTLSSPHRDDDLRRVCSSMADCVRAEESIFVLPTRVSQRWMSLWSCVLATYIPCATLAMEKMLVEHNTLLNIISSAERRVHLHVQRLQQLSFVIYTMPAHAMHREVLHLVRDQMQQMLRTYAPDVRTPTMEELHQRFVWLEPLTMMMFLMRVCLCKMMEPAGLHSFWPMVLPWMMAVLRIDESSTATPSASRIITQSVCHAQMEVLQLLRQAAISVPATAASFMWAFTSDEVHQDDHDHDVLQSFRPLLAALASRLGGGMSMSTIISNNMCGSEMCRANKGGAAMKEDEDEHLPLSSTLHQLRSRTALSHFAHTTTATTTTTATSTLWSSVASAFCGPPTTVSREDVLRCALALLHDHISMRGC